MTPAAKRRWLQFSLRTLFVVMTVVGAWLGYQWNWIMQRHRAFDSGRIERADEVHEDTLMPAPGMLGFFGERGYEMLLFNVSRADHKLTESESGELDHLQQLFPEAEISLTWTEPEFMPKRERAKKSQSGSAFDGFQL